jgi:amino acid transporter
MEKNQKLSLLEAILINCNIIIGTGIFINTTELAKRAGILGAFSYGIVGILLFPLIFSFVRLLQLYPVGGFYAFSKPLHPFVGFLNTWCYFATKMSSATLAIHIFVLLIQKTFPFLAEYNPLILDIGLLSVIMGLNMLNIRTGSSIQNYLMVFKLFPLFLVIFSGLFLYNPEYFSVIHHVWEGIPSSIPLVMHALVGFEAICAISRTIKNPEKNAPLAIIISYSIVIMLYMLYQIFFYSILGPELAAQTDYRGAFPLLLEKLSTSTAVKSLLCHIIHIGIATSALSASFGIIFANMWNIYSLAELKHLPGADIIMRKNRFNVPFMCVLIEGIIALSFLFLIRGTQTTFQQLSAFGATLTYTISIISLIVILHKKGLSKTIPLLGLINCFILLSISLFAMWRSHNPLPLFIFIGIIGIGALLYRTREHDTAPSDEIV